MSHEEKKNGSNGVEKVLQIKNKKGEVAYGDEDKKLHFERHRLDLKKLCRFEDNGAEETVAVDSAMLESILMQQAVDQTWMNSCRWNKLIESFRFAMLIIVFTMVAVSRVGSEVTVKVSSDLSSIFSHEAFGGFVHANVSSPNEALHYFENVSAELGSTSHASLFADFSVGFVLGSPTIKQWRYPTRGVSATGSSCSLSPKVIARQIECLGHFGTAEIAAPPDGLATSTGREVGSIPSKLFEESVKSAFTLQDYGSSQGNYPSESFFLEVRQNSCSSRSHVIDNCDALDSAAHIRALSSAGWVNESTKALSFEVHGWKTASAAGEWGVGDMRLVASCEAGRKGGWGVERTASDLVFICRLSGCLLLTPP